jgi:DNA-binding transcriptional LysR family regulator
MLENLSLDQLRTFIAAADCGSFSAAGRSLHRAQSVVSQTLAKLEAQLQVSLFDRSRRYPVLTDQGRTLLARARLISQQVEEFKGQARALAGGLEPELALVTDVLFPMELFTAAITLFRSEFPSTPLRMFVETLGAVLPPVLMGRCQFGIMAQALVPGDLASEALPPVALTHVVAAAHPLASYPGPVPRRVLCEHVQLVLTDRSQFSAGQEFGVFSDKTWRLSDLSAKHEFLRAGLGWGGMPRGSVAADLARGTLVPVLIEDAPQPVEIPMAAVYRRDWPPGPAGRWLIERLRTLATQADRPRPR